MKDCVNNFLTDLGFWSAVGLFCCFVGAGLLAVLTEGATAVLIVPIITQCLELVGVAAGGATILAVANCMIDCLTH